MKFVAVVVISALSGLAFARMPIPLLDNGKASSPEITSQSVKDVVTRVEDGDTIYVQGRAKGIRLASIDAPETSHGPKRPGQPFSQVSKNRVNELLGQSPRSVELQCFDIDRYGRSVCNVTVTATGINIGHQLVTEGLAWANTANGGRYLRDSRLVTLQASAKARRIGLWADENPTPPWDWRKSWTATAGAE